MSGFSIDGRLEEFAGLEHGMHDHGKLARDRHGSSLEPDLLPARSRVSISSEASRENAKVEDREKTAGFRSRRIPAAIALPREFSQGVNIPPLRPFWSHDIDGL